jgi:hypothetical protein
MDEEKPTAFEDLGYRGKDMQAQGQEVYHMHKKRPPITMKRIRYIAGCDKGIERSINAAVADDLISRGFAVCLDREPGCDDV